MKAILAFFTIIFLVLPHDGSCEEHSKFSDETMEQLAFITPLYAKNIMVREQREYYIDIKRMIIVPCDGYCFDPTGFRIGLKPQVFKQCENVIRPYVESTKGWDRDEYYIEFTYIDRKTQKVTFAIVYKKDNDIQNLAVARGEGYTAGGSGRSFPLIFDLAKMRIVEERVYQ